MNYRTSELAKLAGVSQRTIRFYENEGLLVAQRDPQNQYRYFGTDQVDRLQQILFYRQLGLPISQVKKMMLASDYEIVATLQQQHSALEQQRAQLDQMLQLIDDTIRYQKGDLEMTDEEKFQAFKEASLQENEEKYGEGIREKYGEEVVEKANHQWISQASNNFKRFQAIENDLFKQLAIVAQTHDLESDAAKKAFKDHRKWLTMAWGAAQPYSAEAHRNLAAMYVDDPRFTAYYDDRNGQGTASLLRDIVDRYAVDGDQNE